MLKLPAGSSKLIESGGANEMFCALGSIGAKKSANTEISSMAQTRITPIMPMTERRSRRHTSRR